MNFAASSLIIILVILPGFCFNHFFYAGDLERTSIKRSVVEEVAGIIGISLLIHASAFLLIKYCNLFRHEIDFSCIVKLLWSGEKEISLKEVALNVESNFTRIIIYNLSVCFCGFFFGWSFRNIIRGLRIDLLLRPFRFANPWFYVLTGESLFFREARGSFYESRGEKKIDAVYMDVLIKNANSNIIYRGILRDYKLKEGNLDSLLISNVSRRFLTEEADQKDKNNDPSIFYEIPGLYLIILAREIININITVLIVPRKGNPQQNTLISSSIPTTP